MTFQPTESGLVEEFRGALLGGMRGDIIGAAVEAETPGYIRQNFQNPDQILAFCSSSWQPILPMESH